MCSRIKHSQRKITTRCISVKGLLMIFHTCQHNAWISLNEGYSTLLVLILIYINIIIYVETYLDGFY